MLKHKSIISKWILLYKFLCNLLVSNFRNTTVMTSAIFIEKMRKARKVAIWEYNLQKYLNITDASLTFGCIKCYCREFQFIFPKSFFKLSNILKYKLIGKEKMKIKQSLLYRFLIIVIFETPCHFNYAHKIWNFRR